jgi:hypothetical protein
MNARSLAITLALLCGGGLLSQQPGPDARQDRREPPALPTRRSSYSGGGSRPGVRTIYVAGQVGFQVSGPNDFEARSIAPS